MGASRRRSVSGTTAWDFLLTPGGTVHGVVTVGNGETVGGAHVGLEPARADAIRGGSALATTSASGEFTITGLSPGRYLASARTASAATDGGFEVIVEVGSTSEVRLNLTPTAIVRGTALLNGRPAGNVTLRLGETGTTRWSQERTSARDGSVVIESVPLGRLVVTSSTHRVLSPLTIVATKDLENVTFRVAELASVTGRVTRRKLSAVGAEVLLTSSDGKVQRATYSDHDGAFSFAALPAGTFTLTARLEAMEGTSSMQLEEGEQRAGVALTITEQGSLSGSVADKGGEPVDRAIVTAAPTDGRLPVSAASDSRGAFNISPVSEGSYSLSVTLPQEGVELPILDGPRKISIADRKSVSVDLVVARRHGRIAGRVNDTAGEPVPDVLVKAQRGSSSWFAPQTTSGIAGEFELSGLVDGQTYTIRAIAPSGAQASKSEVKPGTKLTLTLPDTGGIAGTVIGFKDHAEVVAWQGADFFAPHRTQTVDGAFELHGLSPGTYQLVAVSPSAGSVGRTVQVQQGIVTQVRLESQGVGGVSVELLDFRTELAVSGQRCQLAPLVSDERSPVIVPGSFVTDDAGKFEMDAAPAGPHYVLCWASGGFASAVKRVHIDQGKRASVVMHTVKRLRDKSSYSGLSFDGSVFEAVIGKVAGDSPAHEAGLKATDLLVSVNDQKVLGVLGSAASWYLIADLPPGHDATIHVLRSGQHFRMNLIPR